MERWKDGKMENINMVRFATRLCMGEIDDIMAEQEALKQRERIRRTDEADGYFAPEQED
jgi:hypothetical protein